MSMNASRFSARAMTWIASAKREALPKSPGSDRGPDHYGKGRDFEGLFAQRGLKAIQTAGRRVGRI